MGFASRLLDRFFLRRLALQTRIGAGGKLLLELVDSPRGVNELELAGVKRMALAADVEFQLRADAAGFKGRATTAGNGGDLIFGVNAVFH